jgi:hypothetical protein
MAWRRFLTLCVALLAMSVILGILAYLTADQAAAIPEPDRSNLAKLSIVCMALLVVTVVAFLWMVLRFAARALLNVPKLPPAEHVDPWALAGKRFKLSEEDEEEPSSPDAPPDGDDKSG